MQVGNGARLGERTPSEIAAELDERVAELQVRLGRCRGGRDGRSGAGIAFSRDPATGSPGAYGDYLEGVLGGSAAAGRTEPLESLRALAPTVYAELELALPRLEAACGDMCGVDFTVERGRLWILGARGGQRSAAAAVRIAVDLVEEGLIGVDQALARIPIAALSQLQAPVLARDQGLDRLGAGIAAAPGAAGGHAVFDSTRAETLAARGEELVLVRPETGSEDLAAIVAARGVVTARGGTGSHAAVLARSLGRPAVCGVAGLAIDPTAARAEFGGRRVGAGEWITVDGAGGLVLAGRPRLVAAQPESRVAQVLAWCDERRRVDIASVAGAGYVSAGEPGAIAGERVLIDIPWERPGSQGRLERMVERALELGVRRLALRQPGELPGGDLRPPPAPWTLLVADPRSWPARLLATRMTAPGLAAESEPQ
ncbi:MAG: PEP-utilizing enzyme [Solirubrobacterales bacterium]